MCNVRTNANVDCDLPTELMTVLLADNGGMLTPALLSP